MVLMERIMELTFGQAVRRRRAELGLTQEQLAGRIDIAAVDANRISRIENGRATEKLPMPDEFHKWVQALEIEPDRMLAWMGYIDEEEQAIPSRSPEMLFASLADEARAADQLGDVEREALLDGIKTARLLYERGRGR
jgi:transcriptional regulator with XRE-family HTH domain